MNLVIRRAVPCLCNMTICQCANRTLRDAETGELIRHAPSCGHGPVPTDRVRLHVAMWNMARALGINWTTVDASKPDHELLDEIAQAVNPALARIFEEGFRKNSEETPDYSGPTEYLSEYNPYLSK